MEILTVILSGLSLLVSVFILIMIKSKGDASLSGTILTK